MSNLLASLWSDESGQDLVEYVLIVVLIAVAAVAAMNILGEEVSNAFDQAQSEVANGLN